MTKTYSFKVRETNLKKDVMVEYNEYYNRLSDWVCSNLTKLTIGELAELVPEKKHNTSYYLAATDEKWINEPMYKLFTDEYTKKSNFTDPLVANSNNCDNLILTATDVLNPEGYEGNLLSLCKTTYRTFGYAKQVISNMKTKIGTLKPNVKQKVLGENPTYDEKMVQVLYEMYNNDASDLKSFEDKIKYLKSKENPNEKLISRMETLRDFFKENRNDIMDKCRTMAVEQLVSFGGCKRDADISSMTLSSQCISVKRKGGCQGYVVAIPVGAKNSIVFDLYGRRDVIRDGVELVDVCSKHGKTVTIKSVNGELFLDMPVAVNFEKKSGKCTKTVGIDVNTKHMLIQTSVKDNGKFDYYVNLYRIFAQDEELNKILGDDEVMANIKKNAENVSFLPLEMELLYSRILDGPQKYKLAEDRITELLKQWGINFDAGCMPQERIYVQCVRKLRGNLKRLLYLQNKYYEVQQEYDKKMGFDDKSTDSKETMDKRRWESPFRNTEEGAKLYDEINTYQKRIIGIRNSIIDYAYLVLEYNGYDNLSLEYLTSSQFKVSKTFPSTNSLLKYHKLQGKTKTEAEKCDAYASHKSKYKLSLKDGVIDSIDYSAEGLKHIKKDRSRNIIIKAIHFADVKDRFVLSSNNGNASVTFVPSYHTSQIDSTDHKMFVTSKGKIVDKRKVRQIQERHINGLNSDFNAARNIQYISENEEWRNALCKPTENMYNEPIYVPLVKSQNGMFKAIKKLGATKIWQD